jgi:hypothetical protein
MKMKEPDIIIYVSVMEEIKRRTSVIYSFLRGTSHALYKATNVESIYLQIRMILELIALSSIAANKTIFEENQKKFNKHWNPSDILKDIEMVNPNYYPEPIREVPSKNEGIVNDLVAIKDGFLTKDDLISIHGKSGNILHARNPYKKHLDYSEYDKQIPKILEKIKCLLNCHQIRLLGDHDFFYLIHMKEEKDDRVHYYKFQEIKGQQDQSSRSQRSG